MEFIKRKSFWYAAIALLVFITDIWVYFYLKSRYELRAHDSVVEGTTIESKSKLAQPSPQEKLMMTNPVMQLKSNSESKDQQPTGRVITPSTSEAVNQHLNSKPENLQPAERSNRATNRPENRTDSSEVQDNKPVEN